MSKSPFLIYPEGGGEPRRFDPAEWKSVCDKWLVCEKDIEGIPTISQRIRLFYADNCWVRIEEMYYSEVDVMTDPCFAFVPPDEVVKLSLELDFELPELLQERAQNLTLSPNHDLISGANVEGNCETAENEQMWPINWKSTTLKDRIPPHPDEPETSSKPYPGGDDLDRDRFLFWKRQVMGKMNWTESEICCEALKKWTLGRDDSKDKRKTARTLAKRYGDWIGLSMKSHK